MTNAWIVIWFKPDTNRSFISGTRIGCDCACLWQHYVVVLNFFPPFVIVVLTHWGRVTHKCVSKLSICRSDNGSSPCPSPSHFPNQCWNIVNWNHRNKLQWIHDRNLHIFIHENAFENVWKLRLLSLDLNALIWPNNEIRQNKIWSVFAHGTKPLFVPMLTNRQWGRLAFTWRQL